MNILITGATGNIGAALIRQLLRTALPHTIYAGVRDIEKAKRAFADYPALNYREFDFEKAESFAGALDGIDIVFLLRPPHISKISNIFRPLFKEMRRKGIIRVALLSVQGAEKSDIIPHRKIEKLILEYQFEYIFVRPSYFMQNLTTTLLDDIRRRGLITLPAGDAKFNWVDIENIAEVCALYLADFDAYKGRAYVITGSENLDFTAVVARMNEIAGAGIRYKSVSPLRFILSKLKGEMPLGMVLVMCMLHYLPRFQPEPEMTDVYKKLTGRNPVGIDKFIEKNKEILRNRA